MFLLSFPLSLPFDWTLRCWVCVCCFVLFYFGYSVMLCVKKKKKKIVDNKKKKKKKKVCHVSCFKENGRETWSLARIHVMEQTVLVCLFIYSTFYILFIYYIYFYYYLLWELKMFLIWHGKPPYIFTLTYQIIHHKITVHSQKKIFQH